MSNYPFIPAVNFTPANRTRVDLVVLHSMEAPERIRTARNVAEWFAGEKAPRASAHYCVDAEETILCVRETDIAWHAPGANANGIGIEQAGYANQNASSWSDEYSAAMINRVIKLTAEICERWKIPAVMVGPSALLERQRGITTHAWVSKAFKKSTHTDPGLHYPIEWFCGRVAARLAMK